MTTPQHGPHEQVEIERKYDVAEGAAVPDLTGAGPVAAAAARPTVELRAVYLDTDDRALLDARTTLRRRTGGHDEGWHLKRPGDAGRRELHAPLGDGGVDGRDEEVPEALLAPVADVLRGRAVRPVVVLATRRTATLLEDADGRRLAEVADDVVTAEDPASGRSVSWREWEVELAPGLTGREGDEVLDAVERRLLGAGAAPSASRSKLARAVAALGVDGPRGA